MSDSKMEPKTVLIVDDDRDFITAIDALLQSSGYQVRSAINGREGLRLAKAIRPDLILLDIMMTERTEGFFVLQDIRRVPELKHTPLIVISSIYAEQPIFRVSPEAGWLPADLFLPKPVDPARLLVEVRRLIEASDSRISHAVGRGSES
jgi:CheY-like chemotaxis protein